MSKAAERLLAAAAAEIGYHEKAGSKDLDSRTGNSGDKNYTKYARDLDALGDIYNGKKQGYDWCDVFVDWCFLTTFGKETGMRLLCQAYKGCGAGCKYSMQYYQQEGQFHTDPQPGDQIFFGTGTSVYHTGIVESVSGGKVTTIEGNTGPDCTTVQRCVYSLGYKNIRGYGRPDWSLVKDPEPALKPDPEEVDDVKTYKRLGDVPAYYRDAVRKTMELGALGGVADPDPSGLEDNVLDISEELCRMLTVLDRLGLLKQPDD